MRWLVTVCFAFFLIIGTSPSAWAQESEEPSTFEECISRQLDDAAANEMVKSGEIEAPEGWRDGFQSLDDIQKIKEENPERFQELREHYERDGAAANLGQWTNSGTCTVLFPFEATVGAVQDATEGFWGDPIGLLTKAMMEGNAQFMELAMTFWMDFEVLSAGDVAANVEGVKNIVWGVAGFALVASFIVGGARLAASRRSGLQGGVEELGLNVGRWLIFSLCVPVIVPSALVASDILAKGIMDSFGATSPDVFVEMTAFSDTVAGPIVMFVLTLIAVAGSVMQILALVVRVLVLPIAAGLAPLFAALSFSEVGRSGLHHLVGYMIAAVAYKPIAALLYAVVLWNVTRPGSGDEFIGAVINALMIAVVGFMAPQLVRMIAPVVAQAGGSGGGTLLAGAASATGAAVGVAGAAVGAVAGGIGGGVAGKAAAGSGEGASKVGASVSADGGKASGAGSGSVSTESQPDGASKGAGGKDVGGSSGGSGSVSTESQPDGARSSGRSRFRGAVAGARRGVSVGASVGRQAGGAVQQVGGSLRTLESTFEGSLGYPGQIHR